jgi:chemotaxis methyl-accepting protein methylase
MTPFVRFFILALTPLLAVTGSFGPAVIFALLTIVLLAGAAWISVLTRGSSGTGTLWGCLGWSVAVVTLADFITTSWMPGLRTAWGPYLIVLAFSPLVVVFPAEGPRDAEAGRTIGGALRIGGLFLLLMAGTAFVRELMGHASLTLMPDKAVWTVPGIQDSPLAILATGAGGLFLAAAGVVGYRAFRSREDAGPLEFWGPEAVRAPAPPPPPAPNPILTEPPVPQRTVRPAETPKLESQDKWGETLASAVADLPSSRDKRRLLVIGSGNGELVYYLAMLGLEQDKSGKDFAFRVRGVDHFATRVEAAQKGVYREHQIEMIPTPLRDAWMTRGQGEERSLWRVSPEPRLHVQFEVADFQTGTLFFPQPSHLIVLNQGIEYVSDDKKAKLLATVCDQLVKGGALIAATSFKRQLLPEGMKRTGTDVFRKT